MDNLIKETKELFRNQIIDYLNDEIDTTKQQLKHSIESCDKNYFSGSPWRKRFKNYWFKS